MVAKRNHGSFMLLVLKATSANQIIFIQMSHCGCKHPVRVTWSPVQYGIKEIITVNNNQFVTFDQSFQLDLLIEAWPNCLLMISCCCYDDYASKETHQTVRDAHSEALKQQLLH